METTNEADQRPSQTPGSGFNTHMVVNATITSPLLDSNGTNLHLFFYQVLRHFALNADTKPHFVSYVTNILSTDGLKQVISSIWKSYKYMEELCFESAFEYFQECIDFYRHVIDIVEHRILKTYEVMRIIWTVCNNILHHLFPSYFRLFDHSIRYMNAFGYKVLQIAANCDDSTWQQIRGVLLPFFTNLRQVSESQLVNDKTMKLVTGPQLAYLYTSSNDYTDSINHCIDDLTNNCQYVHSTEEMQFRLEHIGFAILKLNNSVQNDVDKLANGDLWKHIAQKVTVLGNPIFQKFRPDGQLETEGDQRKQQVIDPAEGDTDAIGTWNEYDEEDRARMLELKTYSALNPNGFVGEVFKSVGAAALVNVPPTGDQPQFAQIQHVDYQVNGKTPLLKAPATSIQSGPEGCSILLWPCSHKLLHALEALEETDVEQADELLQQIKSLRMVRCNLKPYEMLIMHGNLVHAGCANTGVRLHQYLKQVDDNSPTQSNFTVLLEGIHEHLPAVLQFNRSTEEQY